MWIFTKCGFFSVTQHPKRKDNVQIRARVEQDLIDLKAQYRALDRCPIHETPQADYRWRLVVQRWKWELVAQGIAQDIDYSNFKGKIATIPTQRNKGQMLHEIWDIHHRYQQRRYAPDPHAGHPDFFWKGDNLIPEEPEQEPDLARSYEETTELWIEGWAIEIIHDTRDDTWLIWYGERAKDESSQHDESTNWGSIQDIHAWIKDSKEFSKPVKAEIRKAIREITEKAEKSSGADLH